MRRQKQWEYLEQADPEEDLEQHLEALEKAKAKAEKKLKELKQKKQEEEEEEEEEKLLQLLCLKLQVPVKELQEVQGLKEEACNFGKGCRR